MASVELKNIYKLYPGATKPSVIDFNLMIEDKEFVVFVGPSGCGKSTTLRMIAGLEDISHGELYIDGELKNNVPARDRDIAMVFQNYALYPHMTVYDNMAFGLKLRKYDKAEIDERVKNAAKILGIEDYLSRKPKALSGGQRQRVALGRAIVREPKVFLLDEPLSNLDAKLRSQMRTEITKLHNRLDTTFIYVTHDQIEAMTMGTRIVVMKDGYMQQVDSPINLYDHPINQFVAGFIGTPQMNFFAGKLTGTKDKVVVEFGNDKIILPKEKAAAIYDLDKYLNTDREIIFGVRPEDVHDEETWIKAKDAQKISVKVDVVEALGPETLLYCKTFVDNSEEDAVKSIEEDKPNLIAKVDSRSTTKSGTVIDVAIDVNHCHIFDKYTEITLIYDDVNPLDKVTLLQDKKQKEKDEENQRLLEEQLEKQRKAEEQAEKALFKKNKKNKEAVEVENAEDNAATEAEGEIKSE